jgi:hypothetical protein
MRTRTTLFAVAMTLGACSTPQGQYPSLAPRAAEAVDPRVPVDHPIRSGPVDPQLAAHLAALVDQAQSGDAAFRDAAATAERLAEQAGPAHGESWVAAQQALSAAQAARAPTTRAIGDIDGLGSSALATRGGISAANKAAIEEAAAKVSQIDQAEAERLAAIQARLGS